MSKARMGGATVVLAVAVLIGLAIGAGLIALRTVGAMVEQSDLAKSALTVRIVSPQTPEGVEAATAVMRRSPGVRSVTPMDGARAAELLETWSGSEVDPDSLPASYLIEVRLAPDALRDSAKVRIGDNLATVGVDADIYDAGPALNQADRAINVAAWGSLAAVVLIALAVVLVSRAGALARPEMALLVADLGGERPQVLARYGRAGAEMGFLGGGFALLACVAAAGALWFLTDPAADIAQIGGRVTDTELLLVLIAPLVAAALCTLGARAGAGRVFTAAERVG